MKSTILYFLITVT